MPHELRDHSATTGVRPGPWTADLAIIAVLRKTRQVLEIAGLDSNMHHSDCHRSSLYGMWKSTGSSIAGD